METDYREYSFGVRAEYGEQVSVETAVSAAERGGAMRVLSLEAEAKAVGVEMMAGEALVSGKVNYRLLYLDASEKPCGLDYFKDFEVRLSGDRIAVDGKWRVDMHVVDAEAKVAGDTVDMSAVVEVTLSVCDEVKMRGVAAAEGVELAEGLVKSEKVVGKRSFTIDLAKEETVGALVKKVLLFDAEAAILSVTAKDEKVNVAGEARATVVYLTEEDEVRETLLTIPFSEETEATGEKASHTLVVKNARIVISGDENVSSFEAEMTAELTTYDLETEEVAVSTDAFSAASYLETASERVTSELLAGECRYRAELGGVIPSEEPIGRVVSVRPVGLAVANVEVGNGNVHIEGVSSYNVFGVGEEYRSVRGEFPFVLDFACAAAEVGMRADVSFVVLGASGKPATGGVNVTADVVVTVALYKAVEGEFLSEIKEGAPREDDGAGISVYFAEAGEDLWSVAKNMGVAPSVLLRANPYLAEPLTEAKKVLVFKAK